MLYQGDRVEIDQPNAISFSNKTMGGVDRMDQKIDAYMIIIHKKKWWWPLFWFCVDLAVNNAFQLYRLQPLNQGQKQPDLLGFRREIVQVYHARFRLEKTLSVIFAKKHTKCQSRNLLWWNRPLDCQTKPMAMCQMLKNKQIFLWTVQFWSSSRLF